MFVCVCVVHKCACVVRRCVLYTNVTVTYAKKYDQRSRAHMGRSKVTYLGGPHRGANVVHHLGDIVY